MVQTANKNILSIISSLSFSWWSINLSRAFSFHDPELPIINILCGWSEIYGWCGLWCFKLPPEASSKLIVFVLLYYFAAFNFFIFMYYFLRVPYAFVSTESMNYIFLTSQALNAILLIFSVNTFCYSLLSPCCNFNINILFLKKSLRFALRRSISSLFLPCFFFFIIFKLSCFYTVLIFFKFNFFLWGTFLYLLIFYFHNHYLLNSYTFLSQCCKHRHYFWIQFIFH